MRKVIQLSIIFVVLVAGCIEGTPTGEIIANETFEPECTTDWDCGFWSDCERINSEIGVQNRECIDKNDCGTIDDKPEETRACGVPQMASKEPSEMALQTSDLPSKRWAIIETSIRFKEEVTKIERDLGFKKGYNVSFFSDEINVKQFIGVYPLVNSAINMSFSFEAAKQTYRLGRFYENTNKKILSISELSDPFIGDLSIAYNVTVVDFGGLKENIYTICFTKWDVAEVLIVEGIESDYEFLKNLAKIAEGRIS